MTSSEVPELVLEQVIRTESQLILDDARGENAFAEDEYIGRKQARSLLCLPFLKQGELIGVCISKTAWRRMCSRQRGLRC